MRIHQVARLPVMALPVIVGLRIYRMETDDDLELESLLVHQSSTEENNLQSPEMQDLLRDMLADNKELQQHFKTEDEADAQIKEDKMIIDAANTDADNFADLYMQAQAIDKEFVTNQAKLMASKGNLFFDTTSVMQDTVHHQFWNKFKTSISTGITIPRIPQQPEETQAEETQAEILTIDSESANFDGNMQSVIDADDIQIVDINAAKNNFDVEAIFNANRSSHNALTYCVKKSSELRHADIIFKKLINHRSNVGKTPLPADNPDLFVLAKESMNPSITADIYYKKDPRPGKTGYLYPILDEVTDGDPRTDPQRRLAFIREVIARFSQIERLPNGQ